MGVSISLIRSGVLLKDSFCVTSHTLHGKFYLRPGCACLYPMLAGCMPAIHFAEVLPQRWVALSLYISPTWEHFHATAWLMLPSPHCFRALLCLAEHRAGGSLCAGTCPCATCRNPGTARGDRAGEQGCRATGTQACLHLRCRSAQSYKQTGTKSVLDLAAAPDWNRQTAITRLRSGWWVQAKTGWEPWITLRFRHHHTGGEFGSIYAYLPPSAESSCSAGVSSTWPGKGCQGRMPLCQGAVPGWGSGRALGLGALLVPGDRHSCLPCSRADASGARQSQTYGVRLREKGRFARHQAGGFMWLLFYPRAAEWSQCLTISREAEAVGLAGGVCNQCR